MKGFLIVVSITLCLICISQLGQRAHFCAKYSVGEQDRNDCLNAHKKSTWREIEDENNHTTKQ